MFLSEILMKENVVASINQNITIFYTRIKMYDGIS